MADETTPNSELLRTLYGFLSNPDEFENFLSSLDRKIVEMVKKEQSENTVDIEASNPLDIDHHLSCAAEIFDKIGLGLNDGSGGSSAVDGLPLPAALLDASGKVTASNDAAQQELGIRPGDSLTDLSTDSSDSRQMRDELQRLFEIPENELFVMMPGPADTSRTRRLFTLTREFDARNKLCVRLLAVDLGWDEEVGNSLGYSFGLTGSEQDILKGIVAGKDFQKLATERGRSLETVRTQAKSLLRKTGAKTQVGLVRLFAAISIAQSGRSQDLSAPAPDNRAKTTHFVNLPDGRRLQVDEFGPKDGRPVILFHGLFSGTDLIPGGIDFLHTNNLRVLAPWRPGFAGSTPPANHNDPAPAAFARDVRSVLNHFSIDKAVLLGRFTGAIYSAAASQALPSRTIANVMVSTTPPLRTKSQLKAMSGWQKLFAYSIVYFPSAIPILVRGMRQFLFRQETAKFMAGFYPAPDADVEASKRPDIISIIEEGVENTFRQGTGGHESDLLITGSDWSSYLISSGTPTVLLHGTADPMAPLDQIEDIAAEIPRFQLKVFENEGQLFGHSKPELVFGEIVSLLEDGKNIPQT